MLYNPMYSFSGLAIVAMIVASIAGIVAIGARYLSVALIFQKAGEKTWKSLIPIYDWYTMFKLFWEIKWFIAYIVSYVGVIVCEIIVSMTVITAFYGVPTETIIGLVFLVVFLIASFVIYIIMSHRISTAFGHGGGFTVGLVLLPLIFYMILAFGESECRSIVHTSEDVEVEECNDGILRCLAGDIAGASIIMEPNQKVIIGRDPAVASVVVGRGDSNGKVSRKHCVVQYDGINNVFYVTDESKNGVFFENGTQLTPGTRTALQKGSVIVLPGGIKFLLK